MITLEQHRELRMIRRGLEMSAGIMDDEDRTGGWSGAHKVARSFARYAARLKAVEDALVPLEGLEPPRSRDGT